MFSQNEVIMFETGTNDDYDLRGPYTVVRDFSDRQVYNDYIAKLMRITDAYKASVPKSYWPRSDYLGDFDGFISYLLSEGMIERCDNTHWNLGDFNLKPTFQDADG